MQISPTLSVAERLVMTLEGLYRAVASRSSVSVLAGRGGSVLAAALITLICARVRRVEARIVWMLARFREGRLRVGTVGRSGGARGGSACAGTRLPRRFGWLLPLVPCDAANFASQLRVTLAAPEMAALLAAAPQAVRLLLPLCRMLGIEAEVLGQPAKPAPVARTRVRKPRVPVDWGRIPLPRGVLAAARRRGDSKT